jgi:hypothetical protein
VRVDELDIDALQTAQDTFAQEAAVGPAAVFRNLLMGVVTLADRAPADQVKARAAEAVAFARKQGWSDQEVAIAVIVSGALLKERRFGEALDVNAHAREMAQKATAAGHPAGRHLVLQTWFGEAGTHLAAGDPLRAANAYREASLVAYGVPNLVLAIEALRMEAFCRARAGEVDASVEAGLAAMRVGARLKPDARPMTTLPIAAFDLMRVLDPKRVRAIDDIRNRQSACGLEALQALERSAVALEGEDDAQPFDEAEAEYARRCAAAQRDAERELEAIARDGDSRFADVLATGRELLGAPWPLANAAAAPPRAVAHIS